MKITSLTLSGVLFLTGFVTILHAQNPPQAINYQAVARDAGGNLITTPLTARMSIRQGSSTGAVVYQETHNVTPNTYGLFNLAIGQGSVQSGSFSGIDWSAGPYFVQVELNSGSGYVNMGTQQMLSVPYALYSGKSNMALNDLTDVNTGGVATGQVLKWDGSQWVPANDIGGGAGDNWGTQVVQTTAVLGGDGTSGNPLTIAQQGATNGQVLKWNGTTWAPANDNNTTYTAGSGITISGTTISAVDASATNEIQTLSLSSTTLSLSNGGGSVDLSSVTANAWQIGGNSVTSANFLGTTNTQPLRFRTNNEKAGHLGLPGDAGTFFGYQAGNNDDGTNNRNTFMGYQAGYSTNIGEDNVGVGYDALYANTTGSYNAAAGRGALYTNTTGSNNTASGSEALYTNTTGSSNSAVGMQALYTNTTGSYNTATGMWALYYNTTQNLASAFGYSAGDFGASSQSAFLGAFAYPQTAGLSNVTGLGYEARPTASNQVRVGNNSVTSIGGYVNWTNVSDGRFKKDVQANVPGLEFIMKLRPVTYHMDVTGLARYLGEGEFAPNRREEPDATTLEIDRQSRAEKETILYTGFIAQEVEKAARELGYDFSGVDKPQNEKSLYGLRYAEFVVPLVKAIQEQQKIIEEQRSTIAEQNARITEQNARITEQNARIQTLEVELGKIRATLEASAAGAR